jgi:hypothetical protein
MKLPNNIIELGGITKLDIDPDRILKKAVSELNSVVIAGYDKEDNFYFCSSIADGAEILWLIEHLKRQLLNGFPDMKDDSV